MASGERVESEAPTVGQAASHSCVQLPSLMVLAKCDTLRRVKAHSVDPQYYRSAVAASDLPSLLSLASEGSLENTFFPRRGREDSL